MAIDVNGLYIPEIQQTGVFGSTSSVGSNEGGLTQQLSPTQTQAVSNPLSTTSTSLVGIGANAVTTILSGIAETRAFEAKVKNDSDARIANMDNVISAYEIDMVKTAEALNAMNSMFADKVTERGLKAMKDEALLRAGAAETGTSGGSTSEAVNEAFVTEAFDVANINAQKNEQNRSILAGLDVKTESASNKLASIASGTLSVDSNPWLSGLTGAASSFAYSMAIMTKKDRADLFGLDTEGSGSSYNDLTV